jgi:hypothetical protein
MAARAAEVAFPRASAVLLLNDDTLLDSWALEDLLNGLKQCPIVVGWTRSQHGAVTYGGLARVGRAGRLRFRLTTAESDMVTFNGNVVLMTAGTFADLGGIDPAFTHGMGDIDLGLRATAARIPMTMSNRSVGVCDRNAPAPWRQRGSGWWVRLRAVRSAKALPPREWLVFSRRHGGPFWPVWWLGPYAKALLPDWCVRTPR